MVQYIAESIESTPEHGTEDASQQSMLCGHTGSVSLAETPVPMVIKEDPHSPDEDPRKEGVDKQISPVEIALSEEGDHAGLAEADRMVQSEQRAMQELHRFQKHSMPTTQTWQRSFLNCVALQEIVIPTELRDVGNRAFCGCEKLQRFTPLDWGDLEQWVQAEHNAFFMCDKFEKP